MEMSIEDKVKKIEAKIAEAEESLENALNEGPESQSTDYLGGVIDGLYTALEIINAIR